MCIAGARVTLESLFIIYKTCFLKFVLSKTSSKGGVTLESRQSHATVGERVYVLAPAH